MYTLPDQLPQMLQELPPKAAHLCLAVERFIRKELNLTLEGQSVVVALSGGVDSTALLLILHYLAPKLGIRIEAAHLNHALRPEATTEASFARDLSGRLGIPFHTDTRPIAELASRSGKGIEETARTERYAFLQTVRTQCDAHWICTAHHADDLTEDVLMRLIRGTGWPALGGMAAVDTNRHLFRPLLVTKRNKLEWFLNALRLPHVHDASNDDLSYLRNRVRHTVVPLLKKENPAFTDAVANLWQLAQIDDAYWQTACGNALQQQNIMCSSRKSLDDIYIASEQSEAVTEEMQSPEQRTFMLEKSLLHDMPQALRLRLYKTILDNLGDGQMIQSALLGLDAAWQANTGGKTIQFSGGKQAIIQNGGILFQAGGNTG